MVANINFTDAYIDFTLPSVNTTGLRGTFNSGERNFYYLLAFFEPLSSFLKSIFYGWPHKFQGLLRKIKVYVGKFYVALHKFYPENGKYYHWCVLTHNMLFTIWVVNFTQ